MSASTAPGQTPVEREHEGGWAGRWWRPPRLRAFDVGERHATWLELFFDLCFVAAIAALAADLHHDPTTAGVARFCGLFVPVWWAWMGFTWYATAFDTDDVPFRLALLTAMLTVICLAAGVGGVAAGQAAGFVLAYAALTGILAGLYLRAWRRARVLRPYCARYGLSNLLGAALWLSSLLVPPPARYGVWALAMLALMTGPVLAVRAYPGQAYDAGHIPERYGLFTLIVLGESVVAVSAGTADAGWSVPVALAAGTGFGLAAAVWWLYFSFVSAGALSRARLLAAFTWGYGQLCIFAGIAAAAVGVELAIEGAAEHHGLTAVGAVILCGGIAAFLLAISAIHAVTVRGGDAVLAARLAAAGVAAALAVAGSGLDPVLLLGLLVAALVVLTLFEMRVAAYGRHRGAVPVEPPRLSETN
jgi:low temperature requirement protein LtrA